MKTAPDKNLSLGFALAGFGTLLFSLKSIFIKFLYAENMDADEVLVLRMAMSLPIYIGMLIWSLSKKSSDIGLNFKTTITIFALGFFGYYLASLLDLMGLELISAQLERLSLFTYPFMVALLGYFFFNENITRRIIISLIVTYAGLYVVMGHELKLVGEGVVEGTLMVLGAALSFAFYVLFSKRYIKRLGSQLFTCIAMISSCIFGLLHGVVVLDFSDLSISHAAWFWLVMLVILSTVIPSFMMTEALSRIGPTQTGIVGMLGPIFTIVLAIYLLGEPFSVWLVLGVALMMVGVANLMVNRT
ncbi:MAG: DMT family transporter [Gammaproteobacteria bacterium]